MEPPATLDKGKGKTVEKSVPEKRSYEPDPHLSGSSSKTRRTRRK